MLNLDKPTYGIEAPKNNLIGFFRVLIEIKEDSKKHIRESAPEVKTENN